VLLIEDDADTVRLMSRVLRSMGCQVRSATTVHDAIDLAWKERFQLVISDIGLPDGSGLEVMRELSSRFALSGIAVSGYGTEEDVRRSLEAGFAQHITKPLNPRQLLDAVNRLAPPNSDAWNA
jgi:CheY-like chemotaxis protein